jgi:starvation-inducible outer membrane lipoprotein
MKTIPQLNIPACLLGLLAMVLSACTPAPKAEPTKEEIIQKAWTAMFGKLENGEVGK